MISRQSFVRVSIEASVTSDCASAVIGNLSDLCGTERPGRLAGEIT